MTTRGEIYRRYRQCLRKKKYLPKTEAQKKLEEMKAENPYRSRGLHVYKCEFCTAYHLGHGKPPKPVNFPDGWEASHIYGFYNPKLRAQVMAHEKEILAS